MIILSFFPGEPKPGVLVCPTDEPIAAVSVRHPVESYPGYYISSEGGLGLVVKHYNLRVQSPIHPTEVIKTGSGTGSSQEKMLPCNSATLFYSS